MTLTNQTYNNHVKHQKPKQQSVTAMSSEATPIQFSLVTFTQIIDRDYQT